MPAAGALSSVSQPCSARFKSNSAFSRLRRLAETSASLDVRST